MSKKQPGWVVLRLWDIQEPGGGNKGVCGWIGMGWDDEELGGGGRPTRVRENGSCSQPVPRYVKSSRRGTPFTPHEGEGGRTDGYGT